MALWGDSKEKKPKAAKSKSKGTSASSSSSTSTSSSPAPLSSAPKKQKGATGGTDSSAGGKGKAAKTGKEGKEKEAKQKHVRTRTLEEDMARWQRENQVKVKVIRKKIKDPEKSKLKNLPRKLRRHLKSCTIETFAKMIYTPLYDNFLKTRASETIYKSLMKKVRRRAQQLMVDLDPEFGKRFFHQPNISYFLEHNETLSKFQSLVATAGLQELFLEKNKTVFVPTNGGMEKVFPGAKFEQLLANNESARSFVRAHVLEGSRTRKKLLEETQQQEVKFISLAETELEVSSSDEGSLTVGKAKVVGKMRCFNGYLYVISGPAWTP